MEITEELYSVLYSKKVSLLSFLKRWEERKLIKVTRVKKDYKN
jgi:hypothetical protein